MRWADRIARIRPRSLARLIHETTPARLASIMREQRHRLPLRPVRHQAARQEVDEVATLSAGTRHQELACSARYTEARHKAKSRDRERRTVVARIEATKLGFHPFRCHELDVGAAEWINDSLYCARGQAENLIEPEDAACLARCSARSATDRACAQSPTPFLQPAQNRFGPEAGEKPDGHGHPRPRQAHVTRQK
jgi:hypothetical protein